MKGPAFDGRVFQQALRAGLRDNEVPLALMFVDTTQERLPLPAWAGGKINERPLASDAEHLVARWFQDLLQAPVPHAAADFFLLGGDSMLALGLVKRAEADGYQLSIADVRQRRTVEALARDLNRKDASAV